MHWHRQGTTLTPPPPSCYVYAWDSQKKNLALSSSLSQPIVVFKQHQCKLHSVKTTLRTGVQYCDATTKCQLAHAGNAFHCRCCS